MMIDLNAEIEEKTKALESAEFELRTVVEDRDKIAAEHGMLLEKLTTVKNTFAPKLQEQIDENNRLRTEVESLQQIILALKEERALLKAQIADLANDTASMRDLKSQTSAESSRLQELLDDTTSELNKFKAEHDKLSRRLAALQQHLAESEEAATEEGLKAESELNEYRLRVEALERERETWESMATEAREAAKAAELKLFETKEEAEIAREELEEVLRAHERDSVGLANLQSVLNEFQASMYNQPIF
jgi:chromosome segregation ATPase